MPQILPYQRQNAVNYAKTWAHKRNPAYYNFTGIGGDCTNFISQCLYAGSKIMNYTPTFGWYYINANNRSPSWTGVQYLYNFLVNNKTKAVFATVVPLSEVEVADVIQLADENGFFYHSLLVTQVGNPPTLDTILISTHSDDYYNRPLVTYNYSSLRCLHILGVYS